MLFAFTNPHIRAATLRFCGLLSSENRDTTLRNTIQNDNTTADGNQNNSKTDSERGTQPQLRQQISCKDSTPTYLYTQKVMVAPAEPCDEC